MVPCRFDQHRARRRIAASGDFATLDPLAAVILSRHQTEPGHELLRAIEPMEISDLCDEGNGRRQLHSSQSLKRMD